MIFAAGAAPAFYAEVAILLLASAVVAYVCYRIGIMPIVSFLIAGALIGPQALGLVQDKELIEATAEIGVILLLFTIGIEFSLEKLAKIQRLIFFGGGLQVGITVLVVTGLLLAFGVGWKAALFTGFLVALSSTAIVMKLLMDRSETGSDGGQTSLGILIFQDLAVVAMALLVPMLGGDEGSALGLVGALAKAVGIVIIVLVVARKLMPKLLESVAQTCSQEIFLLAIVAICFGTAWLTSLAGVSLSLGAFLAGLVISESRFSAMVFGEILPLQILFSAAFFVSVGLLLDLGFVIANPLVIAGAIGVVLLIKMLATGVSVRVLGYSAGTTAFTTLMLAQVGEFSFVLERAGREVGLFPAGIENGGPETFIAATVVLMMATPFLATLGERLRGKDSTEEVESGGHGSSLTDHVIVAGYGEVGRAVTGLLWELGAPCLVVTQSPEGAADAEARGFNVLRGNYTRRHELTEAGLYSARLLVVADDDPETTDRVVRLATAMHPDLEIVAKASSETETAELALDVPQIRWTDNDDDMLDLIRAIMPQSDQPNGKSEQEMIDLTPTQRRNQHCSHIQDIHPVPASERVCRECLQMGDTWVHLRICMTCGYIGCCDDSENKHATAHFHTTGHPIVKSYEVGEDWAWCYEDDRML
jgi:CPA2 family monovalent cation:H+ antiporter-2